MMYIHFCNNCFRFHILNGHKMVCPACRGSLTEMRMTYMDFVNMSQEDRDKLAQECRNEKLLREISTTYRMYKYSKWYRNQLAEKATMS